MIRVFFGNFLSFQRINFYGMLIQNYKYTYLFTKYFDFIAQCSFFAFKNLLDCVCNHSRYGYHRNIFLRHIYFLTSYLSIDCMSGFFLLENSSIMYVESLILLEESCKVNAVLGVYNSVEAVPSFFQSHPKTNHPIYSLAHYCKLEVSRIYSNADIRGQLCLL